MSRLPGRFWPLAILGIACITSTVVGGPVQGASRTVTFCNKNGLNVEVAWGFDHAEKGLTSAGWRTVAACACRELFTEELRATEIWLLVTKEGELRHPQRQPCQFLRQTRKISLRHEQQIESRLRKGEWP